MESEKLQDLWESIKGIDDMRWQLMLKLLYKMNDNLFDIKEELTDAKNCLSKIAEK